MDAWPMVTLPLTSHPDSVCANPAQAPHVQRVHSFGEFQYAHQGWAQPTAPMRYGVPMHPMHQAAMRPHGGECVQSAHARHLRAHTDHARVTTACAPPLPAASHMLLPGYESAP